MPSLVVTIFGGSGFVGRYLVKRLADHGARIRVMSRDPVGAEFLKPIGDVGQIAPVAYDPGDDASVAAAVTGSDAVVNLVGTLFERGKATFQATHAEIGRRIATAAAAAGVRRLVQISAIGADAKSSSSYARSKAAGEKAASEAFSGATIVRPSVIFGPEDELFNQFAAIARLSPALPLIGGGETRFQPVYVGDVAEAIRRIIDEPRTAGRTYEVGGPYVYTFRELMELMLHEIDRRRVLVPISWGLAEAIGSVLERLPMPVLTRDQVELLKMDNVVSDDAATLADLGIAPTSLEVVLPTYLGRFRKDGGRHPHPAV
ncbi:MAG: complex I NDUFA9 subunit family protein [Rhodospirillaceae bacterium]|nr:complex I NDUFA9 subunit family protein [Rhodospirillaceae bacterium]